MVDDFRCGGYLDKDEQLHHSNNGDIRIQFKGHNRGKEEYNLEAWGGQDNDREKNAICI